MVEIDSMKYWIEQLSNRDRNTVEGYKVYFSKFCRWIGKSPNELIEMKKQALEHNGDRRENMVLESKVKQFMNYLENEAIWYADHRKVNDKLKKRTGYGLGTRKIAYAIASSVFSTSTNIRWV